MYQTKIKLCINFAFQEIFRFSLYITSDTDTGPGLPGGALSTLSTWGAFGVTNLIAATATVPNVWGRDVKMFAQEGWGSLTGTLTWDSL